MLKDKWIITEKESSPDINGAYYYTMILVDNNYGNYNCDHKYLLSKKNLDIGNFTDSDLNPLHLQYNQSYTDVATVESAHLINPSLNKTIKKVVFFGKEVGDFESNISDGEPYVSLRRGDIILIKWGIESVKVGNRSAEYFGYNLLRNYTTGEKAANYARLKRRNRGEYFDKVTVIGLDKCGTKKEPAAKHIMAYCKKFGYISFVIPLKRLEYSTRIGDKILIQRNEHKENIHYEILRNLTIDKMRSKFLQNNK